MLFVSKTMIIVTLVIKIIFLSIIITIIIIIILKIISNIIGREKWVPECWTENRTENYGYDINF